MRLPNFVHPRSETIAKTSTLWKAPAEAMRSLPVAWSRDTVPEEMVINADGIRTNSDAPAEVNGTLSLGWRFDYW